MKQKLLLLIISFCSIFTTYAQDTEFWFVAPDLSEADNCGPKDSPIALVVSNGTAETANVTITLRNGGSPIVLTETIAPNDLYRYDIENAMKNQVENPRSLAGTVTDYGIHITSDVKVTAYYQILSNCNQDIYSLKGSAALGKDFYVPMVSDSYYYTGSGWRFEGAYDQIDIVATEDGTTVEVIPRQDIRIGTSSSSPAGTMISRTLNKGQTLKIMENTVGTTPGSPSLGGTKITSDKPIAVTTSEDLIGRAGTGQDLIGDQIVPINSLGKTYVVPKGYLTGSERVYMIATVNGTTIDVNDGNAIKSYSLPNAGDTCVFNMGDHGNTNQPPLAVYITASEPIYCYHVTGHVASQDELGSALLPSIYSIGQTQLSYYQYQEVGSDAHYAFMVYRTGTENGFTINYNGTTQPLPVTPINIPGLSDWKTTKINLPAAANNSIVTIRNSNSAFSFGYFSVNTSSGGASYGYLSAFGDFKFPYDTIYKCSSTPFSLEGGYAKNYIWTLPDGSVLSGNTLSSIPATQSGKYILTMDQDPHLITDSCHILDIAYDAEIISNPSGTTEAMTPVTFSVNMNPIKGLKLDYEWEFSDGAVPATSTSASPTVTWYESGNKTATLKLSYTGTLGDVCDTTLVYNLTIDTKVFTGGTGKSATVNGVSGVGTIGTPILVYHTDALVYTITAVNNSLINTNVAIYDTIPDGLQILYISDGGILKPGTPRVIYWDNLTVATDGGTKSVNIVTTPFIGAGANQLLYVNKARIIYDDGGTIEYTNETYHSAAAFPVTFMVGAGGTISNGVTQIVDYQSLPYAGVTVNTDPGYTFAGWSYASYTDRNGGTQPGRSGIMDYKTIPVFGDLVLWANFSRNDYTITYHNIDGATFTPPIPANPVIYNIDDTYTPIKLTNPDSLGWTFTGWTGSNGGTPQKDYTIPERTTGNLTYTANWTQNTYLIEYDYDGGIAPDTANPVSFNAGGSFEIKYEPTRKGYEFLGWTGYNAISATKTVSVTNAPAGGPLIYTANWNLINYDINYHYDGGTPSGTPKATYNVTEPFPIIINNLPTQSGRTFVGWTNMNDTIPDLTITIPAGTTGDLDYYAKWSYQFPADTIYNCKPPFLLQSGHDGLSYEWIIPNGDLFTTEDIEATQSGSYILRTNYGSMILSDTIYVLILFPEKVDIRIPSVINPKTDTPQQFAVPTLDPLISDIKYQWTFENGIPATSTSPQPSVKWTTEGPKHITLQVTAEAGGIICNESFVSDITLYHLAHGFFVDQHVEGGRHDGSSWKNAYLTIQEALIQAQGGDFIWVAKGEYYPDANAPYIMNKDSVEIYGGFGAWESYLNERDYAKNPTILKGNGTSVISTSNVSSVARWDGFIVEEGKALKGGGIQNSNSSVTLANMIIRNNTATDNGGGIYSTYGNPVLYNVEISGNRADKGAAMYNNNTNPVLTNVTISGNSASIGGGMYNENSNPEIRNTIIWDNRANSSPNIYNETSTPVITYSMIEKAGNSGASWDNSFGKDKGHNISVKPSFMKYGFDNDGYMQIGDYRLKENSNGINKGNNLYVYEMKTRNIELQTLNNNILSNGIPYDLAYQQRIYEYDVDMGAYESETEESGWTIMHEVHMPNVEGIITNPDSGKYYVVGHTDFVFTVTAKPGYSLDYLVVKTGIPLRDREGVRMEKNDNGSVTVTIVKVWEPIYISIEGISPVSNTQIENAKVWANEKILYVNATEESALQIFTMAGQLIKNEKVPGGITSFILQQGFYVVKLDQKLYKVIIK